MATTTRPRRPVSAPARLCSLAAVVICSASCLAAGPAGPSTRPSPKAAASAPAPAATTAPARSAVPAPPAAAAGKDLAPIPLELPQPKFIGTPKNLVGVRLKITEGPSMPRKPFLAPKGTCNLALKKPVTASDGEPTIGTPDLVTDGQAEAGTESYVELGPGVQWVQIDLQALGTLYAVVVWHEHHQPVVYHDVVVQVADDKDFITNVRTLYNNDHDNTAGLGIGRDWEYLETNEGLLVEAKGIRARYVRLYSNGSTSSDVNRYTEVAVFGLPAKADDKPPAGGQ